MCKSAFITFSKQRLFDVYFQLRRNRANTQIDAQIPKVLRLDEKNSLNKKREKRKKCKYIEPLECKTLQTKRDAIYTNCTGSQTLAC